MNQEDFVRTVDHLRARIFHTEIEKHPWPYLFIRGVFPADVYEEMLASFPHPGSMERLSARSHQRYLMWLIRDGYTVEPVPDWWDQFRRVVFPHLRQALENKFRVTAHHDGAELVYDEPGYELGPHTDTPDRLVTSVFYLPPNARHSSQGTALLRRLDGQGDPKGKGHKWSREFEMVKQLPYVPNSAIFFPRTDYTFHGVGKTPIPRWTLAYDLFRDPRGT